MTLKRYNNKKVTRDDAKEILCFWQKTLNKKLNFPTLFPHLGNKIRTRKKAKPLIEMLSGILLFADWTELFNPIFKILPFPSYCL